MIAFKLWFMTAGIILMGWIAWGVAFTFSIMTIWLKYKTLFFWLALVLIAVGLLIFLYIVSPFNWPVVYNIGTAQ